MFNLLKINIFYDKKYCKKIISKYTGNKNIQILRALSSGALKISDVKRYRSVGYSGYPSPDEEYILINNLSKKNYVVKRYESGSGFSRLDKIKIEIINGKGIITEYWICA